MPTFNKKEEKMLVLFILFWIICSMLSYGFSFGYFQRKYPVLTDDDYWEDMLFSFPYGILGPTALFVIIFLKGYKYGLKFW